MNEPNDKPITLAEAQAAVQQIRDIASDDEAAHGHEDQLREQVLRAIAQLPLTAAGMKHARELARVALQTSDIEFDRWCA